MDELGLTIREAADQITVALGGPPFVARQPKWPAGQTQPNRPPGPALPTSPPAAGVHG
jgi:hypothetical protein